MRGIASSAEARRRSADLALLAVAAIWGVTFPIIQGALAGMSTVAFLQARFLIAILILVPFALRKRSVRLLLPRRSIPPGLLLAAGYLLQTEGLRTIGPSASAFLTGTNVVFVPFLAAALRWERTTRRRWVGVALAWVGIFLLQGMRWPVQWSVGEILTLLCAVAFAGQIVTLGRLAPREGSALPMATGQMVVAWLFLTCAGFLRGGNLFTDPMSGKAWAVALGTGTLATAVAFLVQTWAQKRTPAGHVAIILACEALFAALFSVAFFADRLTPISWVGAVLVSVATLLVTTERIDPADSTPPSQAKEAG